MHIIHIWLREAVKEKSAKLRTLGDRPERSTVRTMLFEILIYSKMVLNWSIPSETLIKETLKNQIPLNYAHCTHMEGIFLYVSDGIDQFKTIFK